MIVLKLNKYNCIENYKYKMIKDSFFERLFCDSEFIISLAVNDVIIDIEEFKKEHKRREEKALRNRRSRMIDVKFYLENNKEAFDRCNIEIQSIEKRLSALN